MGPILSEKEKQIASFREAEESKLNTTVNLETEIAMEQENLSAISKSVKLVEQLNIEGSQEANLEQMRSDQKASWGRLDKKLRKQEESKKKKKDREAAASERLAKQPGYVPVTATKLRDARTRDMADTGEHPVDGDYKTVRSAVKPAAFAPDPRTGVIDMPALLKNRRVLAAKLESYKAAQKDKTADKNLAFQMEAAKGLLEKLNNAVKLWYNAGGVDLDNGRDVSASRQSSAQKSLALALEEYKEAADGFDDRVAELYLESLKQTSAYKEQLKAQETSDASATKQNTGADQSFSQDAFAQIAQLRELVGENSGLYQNQKEKVDKFYRDYLSTAATYNKQLQPLMAAQKAIQSGGAADAGSAEALALQKLDKQMKELNVYKTKMDRLYETIRFLLTNEETDNLVSATYIKDTFGVTITSENAKNILRQDVRFLQESRKVLLDDPDLALTEGEKALRVDLVNRYIRELQTLRKRLRENPDDHDLQKRLDVLVGPVSLNGTPKLSYIDTSLSRGCNENLFKTEHMSYAFNKLTYKSKEGKEFPMPNSWVITRDTYRAMNPAFDPPTVEPEAFVQTQDDICVLLAVNKAHLDGSAPTEPEREAAFQREYQRTMEAYEEAKGIYEAHRDVFDATETNQELLLKNLSWMQIFGKKLQALEATTKGYCKMAIEKDQNPFVTDKQREDLEKAYEMLGGLKEYLFDVPVAIDNHQNLVNTNYGATAAICRERIQKWKAGAKG